MLHLIGIKWSFFDEEINDAMYHKFLFFNGQRWKHGQANAAAVIIFSNGKVSFCPSKIAGNKASDVRVRNGFAQICCGHVDVGTSTILFSTSIHTNGRHVHLQHRLSFHKRMAAKSFIIGLCNFNTPFQALHGPLQLRMPQGCLKIG